MLALISCSPPFNNRPDVQKPPHTFSIVCDHFQGRHFTSMYNLSSQALLQAFPPVTVVITILIVREKVKSWRHWSWSDRLVHESALPTHATGVDVTH